MPCTRHRVFLATLIVACKYLNDSAPKNKHWAEYAGSMFDPAEINLMEKQLLFLLDYDLRFDEQEAILHFAPFMPRLSINAKEARAAAINCAKARVQAHISMPPTPPDDVPAPRLSAPAPLSGVQSLVKRFSSTYLSAANASSRPRPVSRSSSSSTLDSTSTSEESDSGWLTSDSGSASPTSTEASSVCSSDAESESSKPTGQNEIPPALHSGSFFPPRQGRKISSASTCTVKSDSTVATTLEVRKPGINIRLSPKAPGRGSMYRRSGSYLHPQGQAISASGSTLTLPRNTSNPPSSSIGFLSRMWGSAVKGQPQERREAHLDAEHLDVRGTNAFRRLTHSRSALFRSQYAREVDL